MCLSRHATNWLNRDQIIPYIFRYDIHPYDMVCVLILCPVYSHLFILNCFILQKEIMSKYSSSHVKKLRFANNLVYNVLESI